MASETELELEIKKKLTDQLEPTHIVSFVIKNNI